MQHSVVISLAIHHYETDEVQPDYLLDLAWWLCWMRPDLRHLL